MATAEELIETLKQVIDPELMVNIVDLGLIYSVNEEDRKVAVEMTLTSPACPAGPQIVQQAKMALERKNGVYTLPTWVVPPEGLSPEARTRSQPTGVKGPATKASRALEYSPM